MPARTWLFAALVVAAVACSDSDEVGGGSAALAENPANVLSAIVTVETETPSRAGLTATAADHEVVLPPGDELDTAHELPLVGLRPETDYEVTVTATVDGGEAIDLGPPLRFRSGPLPDDLPPIELDVDRSRAAEGLTLVSLKPWRATEGGAPRPEQGAEVPLGYLAVVDQEGFVVWYHATELGVLDARRLGNGSFLFTYDEVVVREIDVLGRPVRELAGRVATGGPPVDDLGRRRYGDDAIHIDTDSAHHDAGVLPNGNLLLLSTALEARTGPSQCGEAAAETTYQVIADVVAEVDADTGDVVREWSLFDVYDPFERPGEELCKEGSPFAPPNFFYAVEGRRDWTHGNSVVLDEERNALVVSLRHLDAVIAIRYQDDDEGRAGELLWELGPDGTVSLDGEPSYYQHAAEVLEGGEVLVYDNGNSRPGAALGVEGDAPPYSRAVIYEIDGTSARQVWEHVMDGENGRPLFTAFLGDVDELDNGNVLITHGALTDADGNLFARVIEVVPEGEAGGDVVFDLRVGTDGSGWTVYRSERFRSLT